MIKLQKKQDVFLFQQKPKLSTTSSRIQLKGKKKYQRQGTGGNTPEEVEAGQWEAITDTFAHLMKATENTMNQRTALYLVFQSEYNRDEFGLEANFIHLGEYDGQRYFRGEWIAHVLGVPINVSPLVPAIPLRERNLSLVTSRRQRQQREIDDTDVVTSEDEEIAESDDEDKEEVSEALKKFKFGQFKEMWTMYQNINANFWMCWFFQDQKTCDQFIHLTNIEDLAQYANKNYFCGELVAKRLHIPINISIPRMPIWKQKLSTEYQDDATIIW
jgi:hypothetical protein